MNHKHILSICALSTGAAALGLRTAPPEAEDAIADDVVMKALVDELGRSMTLTLDETKSPYFVQYAVTDRALHRIDASCGAIVTSDDSKSRRLATAVRVGYYDVDNTNFMGGGGAGGMGGRRGGGGGAPGMAGMGGAAALPLDDSYAAIRQAAWLSTDGAYKNAVETLARKQSFMEGQQTEQRPNDFAHANPLVQVDPRVDLKLDVPDWERRLRAVSARFLEHKHVLDSQVSLSAAADNQYLINSEGTRIRHGETTLVLSMAAQAQAADGAPLAESVTRYASTPAGLPAEADLLKLVDDIAGKLSGRLSATKLDHYMGPVLFEGEASPELFEAMLGQGVTGRPEPVGGGRRRFAGVESLDRYFGKRILPADFQVYDDPRIDQVGGEFLAGHYQIDDEGVPAQRVDVIVDGRLEGMLMSRAPTANFDKSNGHGRGSGIGRAQASVGCMFVQSSKAVPADQLRKMLTDAVREQKLEYGVRIAAVAGGMGGRGGAAFRGGGGRGAGGFPGGGGAGGAGGGPNVGDPIAIFKVYPDGREERVRGCEFGTIDVAALKTILAAGQDPVVHNVRSPLGAAASIIAPPVLFEEVELFAVQDEPQRLPIVPSPLQRPAKE